MTHHLRTLLPLAAALAASSLAAAQNVAQNGFFSAYPTPTGQPLNLPAGTNLGQWTSSVPYAGTGIYPPDTRVSVQLGGVSYAGNVVRQGIFPGDPVWNVPGSNTWLYSNGNNTGAPYTIWNQAVPLTPNSGYYFACYTSNAITPGRIAEQDPQLDLIVDGTVRGSFRVYDDADPLSGHGGLDLWDRRQIFFTSGGNTSAALSLRDSQLDAFGDDFALTAVTVTPNQPPVADDVTMPAVPQNSGYVNLLPLVVNDPDGNNTFRTSPAPVTLLTVPSVAQGLLRLPGSTVPLTAGATLTLAQIGQLQFQPAAGFLGTATFTYNATDEGNLVSNTATYTIPVLAGPAADLAVSKQAHLGPYRAGAATTFVVRVSNLSTATAATGVVVRDVLPAGLAFVSATATAGSYSSGTGLWSIGNLATGATATLSIVATTNLAIGGTTNVATVRGDQPDAVPDNNQASRTIYPGAAYADDFEGRVRPDYCAEAGNFVINGGTGNVPITGRVSYTVGPLTSFAANYVYRTPLLRNTSGAALLTFNAKLFGTTGTAGARSYTVNLLDAANNIMATPLAATAFAAANADVAVAVPIAQAGVYRIEIRYNTSEDMGNLRASLDDVLVRGAGPATRAKDGSNCAANQLPTPQNVTMSPTLSNRQPATPILPLSGTDPDGAVVAFTLASVSGGETQGMLALDGRPVQVGQEISLADASRLTFDPLPSFTGDATFTYFAIDDSGEGSLNTATYTIPVRDVPLPVELTRFEARPDGPADAVLTWATASEKNSAHFDVERSVNGRDFVAVGTVPAAGTSTAPREYRHRDAGAARHGRLLYYRLRQVDLDGTTAFSPVRTVPLGATEALLHPNPGISGVTLDLTALPTGAYTVTLLTLTGQKAAEYTATGGQLSPLDVRPLAAGAYVVRISGGGTQLTRRWVKLP